LPDLIGREAVRDIKKGDCFFPSDIYGTSATARDFTFTRPFGIPVRYHDFGELCKTSNFDFVEFHLSYQDLDLKIADYVEKNKQMGFAVHCPELFAGDHTLDLCSDDPDYLRRSIDELERTIQVTRDLNSFFPMQNDPVLVVNAGGFTTRRALDVQERKDLYSRLANVLSNVDFDGVNLSIQTMPPFPWHFGGQSFHNLFLDAGEITEFSSATGTSVCLDISHSQLACSHFGWDLTEFCVKVAPWVSHIHLSDAEGVDGEGLQIGDGEIDFTKLAEVFSSSLPGIQFLPEIWQGHKNNGEGFWLALERLEFYKF
jgi:N-acetylneuraminate synthase